MEGNSSNSSNSTNSGRYFRDLILYFDKMRLQLFPLAIRTSSTIETELIFFSKSSSELILETAALNSIAVKTDIFHFIADFFQM